VDVAFLSCYSETTKSYVMSKWHVECNTAH